MQFLLGLVHLVLVQLQLPKDQLLWLRPTGTLILLVPAGTARSTVIKLRTAGNPDLSRKTSSPAGAESLVKPAGFSKLFSEPVPETEPEPCSMSLLFLRDILSNREFLVDSRAFFSVFPGSKSSATNGICLLTSMVLRRYGVGPRLSLSISPLGLGLRFTLGLFSSLRCQFPSLEHFNLLIDIKGLKVIHAQCPESIVLHSSPMPQPAFRTASFLTTPPQIQKLLSKFPDVLSSDGFTASNLAIEPFIISLLL